MRAPEIVRLENLSFNGIAGGVSPDVAVRFADRVRSVSVESSAKQLPKDLARRTTATSSAATSVAFAS